MLQDSPGDISPLDFFALSVNLVGLDEALRRLARIAKETDEITMADALDILKACGVPPRARAEWKAANE